MEQRPAPVQGPLVNEAAFQLFSKKKSLLVPMDATPIVDRCVVEETEETEEAQESFDTLLLQETLSMLHRGNILPSRAT